MGKEKIMAKVIEIAEKRDALELSKDEVALGALQELDKINKSAMKDIVDHKGKVLKALSTLESAANDSLKLEKSFTAVSKGIDELEGKMKALGMDANGIQELSMARVVKKEIADFIGGINRVSSTASGLKNRI